MFLKKTVVLRRWGQVQDNLVLSTGLIIRIGHRKAFQSLYGGQFTLSTQLIKPNYLDYSLTKKDLKWQATNSCRSKSI